jgi:hypothetical protein
VGEKYRILFHSRFRARIATASKKQNGAVAVARKPTTVPKCARNITGCTATTASATVMINFNYFYLSSFFFLHFLLFIKLSDKYFENSVAKKNFEINLHFSYDFSYKLVKLQ